MNQRFLVPLVSAAVALTLTSTALAAPETALVSRTPTGIPAGDVSTMATSSADGRFVAFTSHADGLSDVDDDSVANVYLRDRATGTVQLVSRNGATAANDASLFPDVSDDGRYVAFVSLATNLSPADANGGNADVFVYDAQTGTTELVSRADGVNGAGGLDMSSAPSISADGSRVAFTSESNNLVAGDNDAFSNVYVRDIPAGQTIHVSRGAAPADADSSDPAISGNGLVVAFASHASLTGDNTAAQDVFARSLATNTTQLVSRATGPGGAAGNSASDDPSISVDGRFIAFDTNADNLVDDDVDAVSRRVLRRDRLTQTTILISRATGANGAANAELASDASISASGGSVLFLSTAPLVPDAPAATIKAYVRQIVGSTTTLVSRASGDAGAPAEDDVNYADLSADGQTAVFDSESLNLTAEIHIPGQVFARGPAIAPIQPPSGGGGGGGGGAVQPVGEPPAATEAGPPVTPTPGTASTTGPTPRTVAPKVGLRLLSVGSRSARVRIACPTRPGATCRGTLTLRSLGSARFTVGAGKARVVPVALTRTARAAVARGHGRTARATAIVRVRAADSATRTQKQRLRGRYVRK